MIDAALEARALKDIPDHAIETDPIILMALKDGSGSAPQNPGKACYRWYRHATRASIGIGARLSQPQHVRLSREAKCNRARCGWDSRAPMPMRPPGACFQLASESAPGLNGGATYLNSMKKFILLSLCGLGLMRTLQAQQPLNTLSETEKQQGWKLLFDGKTLSGWRSYRPAPTRSWTIEDACLKNPKGNGRPETGGGEILTAEEFTDFDFRFEWRIAAGGNSGVIYFVKERRNAPGAKMFRGDDGT